MSPFHWLSESASKDTHGLRSNPLRLPRQEDTELYARAEKWINSSADRKKRFGPYLPQMTLRDRAKLLDTWRAFHDACAIHNVSYFLVEDTLLGAIRHRGFIPWDDDMDVAMDVRDSARVRHMLSCLPGYTLRFQSNMHWKFFAEDASIVPVVPPATTLHAKTLSDSQRGSYVLEFEPSKNVVMRYPFVDIFFVTQDDKYTWALTDYMVHTIAYLTEDIYPLTVAHFEGYLAPVPRLSRKVLHTTFDANVCLSPFHNYRVGQTFNDIYSVPCQDLAEIYPVYEV